MTKHATSFALCEDNSRPVHAYSPTIGSNRPVFKNVNTLDVEMAVDAWATLSINTRAIEYQEIPLRMHQSLVRALAGSKKLSHLFG